MSEVRKHWVGLSISGVVWVVAAGIVATQLHPHDPQNGSSDPMAWVIGFLPALFLFARMSNR